MSWKAPPQELRAQLDESRRWFATEGREGNQLCLAYEEHELVDLANECMVEANLQEARIPGSRLDGADLSRAVANGIDLHGASLVGTNLSKASMIDANLSSAIATGVRLRKAKLVGSNLDVADLRGADLSGASLLNASLREADLRGADLRSALFNNTEFEGVKIDSRTQLGQAAEIDELRFDTLVFEGNVVLGDAARAVVRMLFRRA